MQNMNNDGMEKIMFWHWHKYKCTLYTATVIRNELGHMQWQHSMAHQLAACMQSNGGHFKHAVITLKLKVL
jgi:hypothetical protein